MTSNTVRALVHGYVESLLPDYLLQRAKIVEAEERKGLDILARVMEKRGE